MRTIFSINAALGTFNAKINDQHSISGTADVRAGTIALVQSGQGTMFTYRISRATGDLVLEAGLASGPVVGV